MNVAILTNFHDFYEGYSLSGIVRDQVLMLSRYGHDVHLFVSEKFSPEFHGNTYLPPQQATLHKTVPAAHLTDYTSAKDLSKEHIEWVRNYANQLTCELQGFDVVLTHDWLFTGWNLPFAATIAEVTRRLPKLNWLHWIHSIPSGRRDWWKLGEMYLIEKNKIVFPNGTDAQRVALQFRCHLTDIHVIPHIKDLRTWHEFDSETCRFIDAYPLYMQADLVQIYPAGSDRLHAKNVDAVIKIFGFLKKKGYSVCLAIANSWAVTAKVGRRDDFPTHDFTHYYQLAKDCGLENGKEFILTSDFDVEKYGIGVPKRILRELMLCANLFIYPTNGESFGLVGPECVLSGPKIMVLNKDLDMMFEVNAGTGIYESFGSYCRPFEESKTHYADIADRIIKQFESDIAVQSATSFRQRLNYDYVYQHHYKPILDKIQGENMINHVL